MNTKRCSKCKEVLPLAEFNKNKDKADGLASHCRSCMKKYRKVHYETNKVRLVLEVVSRRTSIKEIYFEHKSTLSCADCGISNPWLIEFDHTGSDKFMDVSKMVNDGYSWERIKDEIDKCDPVCCNCHRLRTTARAGWDKSIASLT